MISSQQLDKVIRAQQLLLRAHELLEQLVAEIPESQDRDASLRLIEAEGNVFYALTGHINVIIHDAINVIIHDAQKS